MIKYRLACREGHEFEGWFQDSAAYDRQSETGLVTCPECGSSRVAKAIMAPSIAKSLSAPRTAAADQSTPFVAGREMVEMVRRIRAEVQAKAEYVGERFSEEARRIHYAEVPERGIYGEASAEEARALADEGVPFLPLPRLPDDHN
jgi:hypothetical protein